MKAIIKITLLFLLPLCGFSQDGVRFTDKFGPFHDTYQQENDFTNREYVKYPFVREADVLWSKVTWEIIDLREKMNLPLYYPTDTLHRRRSLINAIIDGIDQNQFNAFKVPLKNNAFEFDPNNIFLNTQDIKDIGMQQEIVPVEIRPGVTRDSLITIRWKSEDIKQVLVKEVWYFNRKDSKLHSEIIGICPIREYMVNGMMRRQRLFWIYYPDARAYLSTVPVYSQVSDKPLYSYDDVFVYRYFNSYFVQEANVYNDRMITDYVMGREAQLESQRIKNEIFNFEQDLWEN
ncbi:type IX secretion system ring subunit PorN/GldN [Roseimarinus sediminis]|uniref:type IX secretion system ring protein PorN/GldN n=1 Tax=Roseimarinus sediminis TaxID=1610899 RepID=UPI003D1AACF1